MVIDFLFDLVFSSFAMLLLGWSAHVAKVLMEISARTGKLIDPITYSKLRPWKLTFSMLSAVGAYSAWYHLNGYVDPVLALGIGFGCEYALDSVVSTTQARGSRMEKNKNQSIHPDNGGDETTYLKEKIDELSRKNEIDD